MPTYTIEKAKSGRATCMKSKEKIPKGEIRIGITTEKDDYSVTKWVKLSCFVLPRNLKKEGMTPQTFVNDLLEDASEDLSILNDEEKCTKIAETIEANASKTTTTKKRKVEDVTSSTSILSTLQANADILLQEEEDGKKKKSKLTDEEKEHANAYLDYKSLKNPELADVLRYNNQFVTGSKAVLLTRIMDGYMNGRLARCVTCGKGRLKLDEDGTNVKCGGYFDEDQGVHVPCFATFEANSAPRFQPWYREEPTDEEKAAMEKEIEEAEQSVGSGGVGVASGGSGGSDSIKEVLAAKVEKMEWDLSSSKGIKQAAGDIFEVCSSEESMIDLPTAAKKARMEIGKLILSNKSMSAMEVLDLVIAKYGTKAAKEEAAKVKTKAISAVCANEANVGILEVILELGDLYFKGGNSNAGATYKKVAAAIKDLDYEITADNAKGLGKGKTKVANIGKGSAEKIHEFLTTGKITKLEEKRAGA